MKKGLLNIILLVLAVTNIILSAIVVFSVVPAMNSSTDLVTKISNAINLEKEGEGQLADGISIDNVVTYNFTSKVTVALNGSTNNNVRYAQFETTLTLDKTREGYKDYNAKLAENEQLMIATIQNVVSKYTTAEVQANQKAIEEEVTVALRELYNNTKFIYSTAFVNIVFQ